MNSIGLITVIKTLIIPQLNNLLTLQKPSNDFLKRIENEIYQFLWLGKVYKLGKTHLFNIIIMVVLKGLIIIALLHH